MSALDRIASLELLLAGMADEPIRAELNALRARVAELGSENGSLKRLLKRSLTPLRFASIYYLDSGRINQESRTDALVESIKRALKG